MARGHGMSSLRCVAEAVLYNALMGMNQNIVFEQWRNEGPWDHWDLSEIHLEHESRGLED